jgi:hypothetical protein
VGEGRGVKKVVIHGWGEAGTANELGGVRRVSCLGVRVPHTRMHSGAFSAAPPSRPLLYLGHLTLLPTHPLSLRLPPPAL